VAKLKHRKPEPVTERTFASLTNDQRLALELCAGARDREVSERQIKILRSLGLLVAVPDPQPGQPRWTVPTDLMLQFMAWDVARQSALAVRRAAR
jgi:hypothetical protein